MLLTALFCPPPEARTMESGSPAVTMIVARAVAEPLETETSASPLGPRALTSPAGLTFTMPGVRLLNSTSAPPTGLPSASLAWATSCRLCPEGSRRDAGRTSTCAASATGGRSLAGVGSPHPREPKAASSGSNFCTVDAEILLVAPS